MRLTVHTFIERCEYHCAPCCCVLDDVEVSITGELIGGEGARVISAVEMATGEAWDAREIASHEAALLDALTREWMAGAAKQVAKYFLQHVNAALDSSTKTERIQELVESVRMLVVNSNKKRAA